MSAFGAEGRGPTAPELFRDFEVLLDERLGVERRRRRKADRHIRLSIILASLALLAAGLIAYTLYDSRGPGISTGLVRTREVQLVDDVGRVRGRWLVMPGGATRLTLVDEQGTERMRFTLLEGGAQGITLSDSRGEGRVVLSLEGSEGSRLTFADDAGRTRTVLGLGSNSASTLLFADVSGVPRALLGLEADGRTMFVLSDEAARGEAAGSRDTTSSPGSTEGASGIAPSGN